MGLLELFIDLEMAELRSLAGQVSAEDAQIVQLRVAASVLLPELVHDLAAGASEGDRTWRPTSAGSMRPATTGPWGRWPTSG